MNLEEFRRRRAELTRVALEVEKTTAVVREEMRRTLYDDIAAASIDDIVCHFDVLLTVERSNWDDAS